MDVVGPGVVSRESPRSGARLAVSLLADLKTAESTSLFSCSVLSASGLWESCREREGVGGGGAVGVREREGGGGRCNMSERVEREKRGMRERERVGGGAVGVRERERGRGEVEYE